MNKYIYLIEKNLHGAIVIYGAIGVKQYYYYSKKKAIEKYITDCKREIFINQN